MNEEMENEFEYDINTINQVIDQINENEYNNPISLRDLTQVILKY